MKVRFRVPGFYGVLTQHFDNPDVVYLPYYTSNIFREGEVVFVTRYPDVDKNSILPLYVKFHNKHVVSVHVDKLHYLDADIDGDCVAVWKGDENWEIDDIKPPEFKPIEKLTLNVIKSKVKKLPYELVEELLNCKVDFYKYIDDIHLRFNIYDKAPQLTGVLFKRFALRNYKLFFYDLRGNVRFICKPTWKYKPSEDFYESTKNYDIWMRSLQIVCNRLNSICLKVKHPITSLSSVSKTLSFLKICGINIDKFEQTLGVTHDSRYQSIEDFTFWFEKPQERDAFEIFKVGIQTTLS